MLKGGSEAIYVIILIVKCLRNFRVYEIGTKCFEKKFVRRKLQVFFYTGETLTLRSVKPNYFFVELQI